MDAALRALLIDENEDDRALAALVLRRELGEVEIAEAADPLSFAEQLARGRFDIVVADCRLSWSDGWKALEAVRRHNPDSVCVLFTEANGLVAALEERTLDLDGYLAKGSGGFIHLPRIVREALERREARRAGDSAYRRLVEKLPVGIYTVSLEGFLTQVNPSLAAVLGWRHAEALVGKDLSEFFLDADVQKQWGEMLAHGGSLQNVDVRLSRADGSSIWGRLGAWAVTDETGRVTCFHGTLQEISDFKRAAEAPSRRAAAMRHSDGQLAQFTYAVSHDLQEPLQLIARHARILAERYRGRLDAEARRFIESIVESTDRMQAMIDAILGYLRVGTRARTFKPVDLNGVIEEVKQTLGVGAGSDATVTCDVLPTVTADEEQMIQLFQNLVGNAVKFRSEAPPRVHVGTEDRGDEWVISVRDNGIGIDPQHSERIFEIFQRLHTAAEYPGTGIGLAICKGIVGRHGGRIWVDSRPGEGATFYVALPKRVAVQARDENTEAGF